MLIGETGQALLEVLAAAVIVGVLVLAGIYGTSTQFRAITSITERTSPLEFDDAIATYTLNNVFNYMHAVSLNSPNPVCVNTGANAVLFESYWRNGSSVSTANLPSGIVLNLLAPVDSIPAHGQTVSSNPLWSPIQLDTGAIGALGSLCQTQTWSQTTGTQYPSFASSPTFNFCLSATAGSGYQPAGPNSLLAMQPVVIQFKLELIDATTGNADSCGQLATTPSSNLVGVLYYTINSVRQYGSQKPLYNNYSSSLSLPYPF